MTPNSACRSSLGFNQNNDQTEKEKKEEKRLF
jgi:hypothetical protein